MTLEETADRVRTTREAIDTMGAPFVLTARAECFLVGYPDPLDESIRRLKLYEDAGAYCLYVPGVRSREQITAFLDALTKPVNILVGIKSFDLPLDELETMGVRRISTGRSIICSTLGLFRSAVEGLSAGTLDYRDNIIRHDELTKLFSGTNVSGI
jgi:2-methylisocitrate lyase-like PEP mutase family enzyme